MMKKHVFLLLIMLALPVLLSTATIAQSSVGDLLLYYERERDISGINAYNPATGETLELPVFVSIEELRTSGDGRIAYIQDNDVWVLDVLNAPDRPINITQIPDEEERLIDWTPNGHFLEFLTGGLRYTYDGNEVLAVAYGDERRYWNENGWYIATATVDSVEVSFVWNGQERIDLDLSILPTDIGGREFRWTPDNHFFITVYYQSREYYSQPIGPTEIFYWNGDTVQEVENPSDDETFMVGDWSADGRLTLFTSQDFFDRWYIWDGVSFTPEGVPDTATFMAINADDEVVGDIAWMPDGRLALVVEVDPEKDTLLGHPFSCGDACTSYGHGIYLWDTESIQKVTYTGSGQYWVDVHESGSIAVIATDGERGYGVTVFDTSLQPIFRASGPHFGSRWSVEGNLAYCDGDGLYVWNGQDPTLLSYRTFSKWLLASSPSMLCSTG